VRLSGATADLISTVAEALDARLSPVSSRPLAVGLSGGGDSLTLLLAADAWVRARGRRLLVLTVDHRLQPRSRAWTEACGAHAARLGHDFKALAWTGEKPAQGLPAAARTARHRLLAGAAREAGARVILLGHTADDLAEARAMRRSGSTTPDPRTWAPSPVWPEGRGLFLLRPLLGLRRAEIRAWLEARGETWIDDPANLDLRYARPRARAVLDPTEPVEAPAETASPADLALAACGDAAGVLTISRARLRDAAPDAARAFVAAACLCAAGTSRPPRSDRLDRLAGLLIGDTAIALTLAGARIEADRTEVRFLREPGEAARGGLAPLPLAPGEAAVWDGRFEILVETPGLVVRSLGGHLGRLPPAERPALARLAARARPGLPAIFRGDALLGCPVLGAVAGVRARPLALDRLRAACGVIVREPA
jgi:tRNA(Ile)-lysidine synthase